ncbi:TPA: type II secretion system protein [Salmonella enterica subsp. enterica serovar Wangata]|nr:type II secretion system protein [Salmonella enterica subsp. enterica serovar Wangata]HAU7790796.1 type II secretion system protein [Salmonella enterica subsp. enterica serovar Wangata]HAU7803476.1 type II secretion system protein [Salmonella enterica subsp. enterica serovar Wangata]
MMKSRGFSLLEIIIALAIVGIVLVSLTSYARKMIDEHVRQVDAEAVAQEVYGVLQFVNADTIEIFRSNNPGANVTNRNIQKVTNPLYQQSQMAVYPDSEAAPANNNVMGLQNNPLWLAHHADLISLNATKSTVSPYIARNFSKSITSPISNRIEMHDGQLSDGSQRIRYSHSLKWSQTIWGQNSVRNYFTDSGCPGNTGDVYFKQQYLSCNENPTLRNSEIAVSRVDLTNDKGSFHRFATSPNYSTAINRVDIYVSFTPSDGNPARIEQFITPLLTAFRTKKIDPATDNVYLVMQDRPNSWTLLNKADGSPAVSNTAVSDLALFTDLPQLAGRLQKNNTYGIRFSFDGRGDYLRTDGLNAAKKLCWNTIQKEAGPCLTSPSESLLVLNKRTEPKELASLQVSSVISTISHEYKDAQGNTKTRIEEYYTAPRIQYKAFSNNGTIPPVYRVKGANPPQYKSPDGVVRVPDDVPIAETTNGAISVELQTCPVVDGFTRPGTNDHRLYPRLSAAVSSVVSGLHKDAKGRVDSNMPLGMFDHQGRNLNLLNEAQNFSVNDLGGTVLQVRLNDPSKTWRISGLVASRNINPLAEEVKEWIYFNPSWLSVVITTWCSSVPQP